MANIVNSVLQFWRSVPTELGALMLLVDPAHFT